MCFMTMFFVYHFPIKFRHLCRTNSRCFSTRKYVSLIKNYNIKDIKLSVLDTTKLSVLEDSKLLLFESGVFFVPCFR